jgi:hypothetical protein
MATILEFKPRTPAASRKQAEPEWPTHEPAKPYSFDIYQAHTNGMVSVDACIPAAVAAAMLDMLRAIA